MNEKNYGKYFKLGLSVILGILLIFVSLVIGVEQSHPLSEVYPINVSLNMSNNSYGISYNITDVNFLNPLKSLKIGSGGVKIFSNLNLTGNKITNLVNPTSDQEAATKNYVDTQTQNVNQSATQNLTEVLSEGNSAGSYSINLNLNNITSISFLNPTSSLSIGSDLLLYGNLNLNSLDLYGANFVNGSEFYDDGLSLSSKYLDVSGDSMSGDLNLGSNNITNVDYISSNYISGLTVLGNLDLGGNDLTNVNNYNLAQGDIPSLTSGWGKSIDAELLTDLADLNNKITLMEQNITNENWIEDSEEVNLNVNSSNYWDNYNTTQDFTWSGDLSGTGLSPNIVDDSHLHDVANLTGTHADTDLSSDLEEETHASEHTGNFLTANGDTLNVQDFWVNESGDTLSGNLNLSSNNLTDLNRIKNYFGSACSSGKVLQDVNDDGSFSCVSLEGETANLYVNKSGDQMTGNLDLSGNQLQNLGSLSCDSPPCLNDSLISDSLTISSGSLNASLLSTGEVPNARLSSSVSLLGQSIEDDEVSDSITVGVSGSVDNGALPSTISVSDLDASSSLDIGGGYGSQGLTIDSEGNILTEGNLTYSGRTYVIDTLEFNASADFPYGVYGGRIYPGTSGSTQNTVYFSSDGSSITLSGGNLSMGSGNITSSGLIDGVNLDNPGTGLSLTGNQYIVTLGTSIDKSELTNSGSLGFDWIDGEVSNNIAANYSKLIDLPANIDEDSTNDLTSSTSWSGDLSGTGSSPSVIDTQGLSYTNITNEPWIEQVNEGNLSVNSSTYWNNWKTGLDIDTVGTITSGTWNAGVISDSYVADALNINGEGFVNATALIDTVSDSRLTSNVFLLDTGGIVTGDTTMNSLFLGGNLNASSYSIIEIEDINATDLYVTNIDATNYGLSEGDIPSLTSGWGKSIDAELLTDLADLNNKITLMEQNITNENWIEDSEEVNLNVNSSNYWDNLNVPSDLNYLIVLSEANITDENWIENSQETNLNVNSSEYWDELNKSTDITSLGVITTGTWNATPITDGYLENDITANLTKGIGEVSTSQISDSSITNNKISENLSDSVISNSLTLDGSSSINGSAVDSGAVPSSYIEDAYVENTGDSMSGNLDLSGNNITNSRLEDVSGLTCNSGNEARTAYNYTSHRAVYCNSTDWVNL